MARLLMQFHIEVIHTELTTRVPCFFRAIHDTYYGGPDSIDGDVHESLGGREFWEAKANFFLLVLAAEEELSDYPMKAVE